MWLQKVCSLRYYSTRNTIFALSSGFGKCGVAVLRLSGPQSGDVLKQMTQSSKLPTPRVAALKKIFHPNTKEQIDKGLVLWFPSPNSFTGEDCCEFQVHGGMAIIKAMYESFSSFKDLRLAEPGEFTKRAFYSRKLDLTEIEGLADLIDAETEAQRKQAILQADGALSILYQDYRTKLLRCIANLEAYIDFGEDQHIDDGILEQVGNELLKLEESISTHLKDFRRGERLRNGVKTVILGAPNVGKSSFVNLICQRNISIVTQIAGTTRDIIESHYDIAGYPVILADTAGLRCNTQDEIEVEGINKARSYIEAADFCIILIDSSKMVDYFQRTKTLNFKSYFKYYLNELGLKEQQLKGHGKRILIALNKSDLLEDNYFDALKGLSDLVIMSCLKKSGVEEALNGMRTNLELLCGNPTKESLTLSQERHRIHLRQCLDHIHSFHQLIGNEHPDLAIACQQLRNATKCIGRITGDIGIEEILDYVFKNFCIGK